MTSSAIERAAKLLGWGEAFAPVQLTTAGMSECDDANVSVQINEEQRERKATKACAAKRGCVLRPSKCWKAMRQLSDLGCDLRDLGDKQRGQIGIARLVPSGGARDFRFCLRVEENWLQ